MSRNQAPNAMALLELAAQSVRMYAILTVLGLVVAAAYVWLGIGVTPNKEKYDGIVGRGFLVEMKVNDHSTGTYLTCNRITFDMGKVIYESRDAESYEPAKADRMHDRCAELIRANVPTASEWKEYRIPSKVRGDILFVVGVVTLFISAVVWFFTNMVAGIIAGLSQSIAAYRIVKFIGIGLATLFFVSTMIKGFSSEYHFMSVKNPERAAQGMPKQVKISPVEYDAKGNLYLSTWRGESYKYRTGYGKRLREGPWRGLVGGPYSNAVNW